MVKFLDLALEALQQENGMKKVPDFCGKAKKISGEGLLHYELYLDERYDLYVKIIKNDTDTDSAGTFNKWYFSVKDYAVDRDSSGDIKNLSGIDRYGKTEEVKNSNIDGFLKAVLCHLLRDKGSEPI